MKDNHAKSMMKAGKAVSAIGFQFAHPGLAEYLGHLGFDIIQMDTIALAVGDPEIEAFARACEAGGAVPTIRVRPDDYISMEKYLAFGIMGYHIANTQSADQVREAVNVTKFAPVGKRGIGSFRVTNFGAKFEGWDAFSKRANENVMIKVTIEDLIGLAALPEILKIPEVDMVQLGLHDLAMALGHGENSHHPEVLETHEKARALVQGAGKSLAMTHLIETPDEIREAYKRGSRYFQSSVTRALNEGSKEFLATVKALK